MFKNKIFLITGGTGSFGSTMVKKLLLTDIKEIRIFSRDEKKQEDMRISLNDNRLKFYIGDVRDYNSINDSLFGVDYVFHAAALKQVPSCEFFPIEAVKTNILGSENVLTASINNNIQKIVTLSTDKACYPINVMGATKNIMEKLMISKSRNNKTIFCGTRYGNVMGSRGSVIPLFINQIKNNLPITITDPNMTRFLMTLDEAINLVLFAFDTGKQGEIFIQKSPASTIYNLAIAVKDIFNSKSEINLIGIRHGEKKDETLITKEEMIRVEEDEKYFKILPDSRNLNYNKYFTEGMIHTVIEGYTSFNTKQLSINEIKELLLSLDFIKKELK